MKRKKSVKNVSRFCVLLAIVCAISGCSVREGLSLRNQGNAEEHTINGIAYRNNDQFYADTVSQLLLCMDGGDREGVKALLCSALKDCEDIDHQIDELAEGFEGDILEVTEYGHSTVSAASYGQDYTSAFLSDEFYITTDKQVYYASVAICPLDEKHENGGELVGIYSILIKTLDYASGDVPTPDFAGIEAAGHNCHVQAFYGDSKAYLPVQSAADRDCIVLYRVQSFAGEGGSYEELLHWNSRDFESFQSVFGEPYAASVDNDRKALIADAYLYRIKDSEKYAMVTVYRDTGAINTLRIVDIRRYRNDKEDITVLDHEESAE